MEKIQIFLQHPQVQLCPSFVMCDLISRRLASKIVRGESFSLLVVWPQHNQPLLGSSSQVWGFAFFKALPLLSDSVTALAWTKCSFHQNSLIYWGNVPPAPGWQEPALLFCALTAHHAHAPLPGTEMAPAWKSRRDQELWLSSSHGEAPGRS